MKMTGSLPKSFGRYVAIALNILDLMVVERVGTSPQSGR